MVGKACLFVLLWRGKQSLTCSKPLCTGCRISFQVEYHYIFAKVVLVSQFKFPYERSFIPVSEWSFGDPDRRRTRGGNQNETGLFLLTIQKHLQQCSVPFALRPLLQPPSPKFVKCFKKPQEQDGQEQEQEEH